jgi:hypothetical protein
MQVVDLDVAIGGDVRMVVRKQNVSIAELVVLQAIHGKDAVANVRVVGQAVGFDPVSERERLARLYDNSQNDAQPKVHALFPGVAPQLPMKLSEVALIDEDVSQTKQSSAGLTVQRFDDETSDDEEPAAEDPESEDGYTEGDENIEIDAPPGADIDPEAVFPSKAAAATPAVDPSDLLS